MSDKYLDTIVVNRGNQMRLKNVMLRASRGESVTIGYLGGSITMGSVATTPEKCYAYLSCQWWRENFPQTKVEYYNAGIGATTSQFGVARVDEDLLYARPDVVFIEFSVNDDNVDHFKETYEGLVRHVYTSESLPAVVLLHNSFFSTGVSAEEIHTAVGRYYDLPCVSIKNNVHARIAAGDLAAETITADDLHPNDAGHAMLADTIRHFLDGVYAQADSSEPEPIFPAQPMTPNRYEHSRRLRNSQLVAETCQGFAEDYTPQKHMTDIFKCGWEAWKEGSYMEFTMTGSVLAVQYRRTINKPAPAARVIVDGDEAGAVLLDGEFDETWGDLLALTTIFEKEEPAEHHVRIEVCRTHENDASGFYLVSVITAG
ncbi:MAG: SGNH/GDSL hydrolase family protein [Acetatifactor sp.]|nr:SGNH/GDSL hydrolase family protein [Acetatifactor sp.]